MEEYANQARVALKVYLARSKKALEHLNRGKFKKFERMCKLQRAAFHNYRAGDALAMQAGIDLNQEVESQNVWREIREVNEKLQKAMTVAQEKFKKELLHVQQARTKISKYRSATTILIPGFEQAV